MHGRGPAGQCCVHCGSDSAIGCRPARTADTADRRARRPARQRRPKNSRGRRGRSPRSEPPDRSQAFNVVGFRLDRAARPPRSEPYPSAVPRPPTTVNRRSRRTAWTIAALALLTGVLGALAALAPVTADDPVVSWPQAGQQPTSTVLPLTPYRPLQFDATVPCSTLGALDARGGGEALRTLPADPDSTPTEGLVVAVGAGTVTVAASGSELHSEPLPTGDCAYRIAADSSGITVNRDGAQLAAEPGLLPPQVAELSTMAQRLPEADGLAVELHTDARYESSPTPLKTALLVAHALSLVAVLALAWRHWRGSGPGLVRPRLSPADGVVVAVSLAWAVLGPIGIDDSWYLLMARNATESGYIGNYVSQLNVAENPFVASQYPMQAWGMLGQSLFGAGWGLLWMRVLPVLYGLGTYALLRVLVTSVVSDFRGYSPENRSPRGVAWAVALGHLLWFLPYGVALRPEPLIVLCSAGVLVLAELARRRESIGALAAATVVAVLAVTASPTGLVAAAPLVFALPWLWRWLRAADWPQRAGAVLLAGASASIVVLPGFADATLGNVAEAVSVHRWYYRSHPWYEEYLHYAKILEDGDPGAWGKRLPVLLTLAVLLGAAIAAGRRAGTGGPTGRLLAMSAATTAVALLAMSLTPTKWVNHFGAVAAPASVLLAAAALRSPIPRRAPTAAVTIGAIAVGLAAAVGYAGPNLWRPFGDWGQPFGDHTALGNPYEISLTTPGIGPLDLHNPLLWFAVAAAALWWGRRRRRRGLPSGPSPDRALLVTSAGLGVVLMLAVFSYAPLRQYPGPSLALVNAQAPAGSPCGLAGDVRVLTGGDRMLGPRPVTEVTAGKPVFADQASAALWPCVDQITIANGIAEAPQLRLRTGGGLEKATKDNTARPGNGGTLAQVDRTVEWIELPSALSPAGVPIKGWGHVERAEYDHPPGLVDLRVRQVQRWGWTQLPTLARQDYAGRAYIG
ncbi:MAG: arabinosyltransferase [Pseudonocardiaceae bacterium]|nr:arabinosyltransferase [Pseudonocardiaceae bacterium]